jgi:hypothetical protein
MSSKKLAFFHLLGLLLITVSCKEISQKERELTQVLNKAVNVEMLNQIHQGESTLLFSDLKQKYKHISIVYLKDSCSPCYPKFKQWLKKINLINPPDDYAVLFVIHSESYDVFFRNSGDFELLNLYFFTFLDKDNHFFDSNSNIPDWIYESGFMINDKNEMKMVGAPFFNEDFTAIFHRIVNFRD